MVSGTSYFFFFNDTATTEIYTLSLHDALPISLCRAHPPPAERASSGATSYLTWGGQSKRRRGSFTEPPPIEDRKSTRLNSSHANISYAVFCLKKKKLLQKFISCHICNHTLHT